MMILLIPNSFFFFQALGLGLIRYAIAHTLPWILWFFRCRYYSFKYFRIHLQKTIFTHILLALITLISSFFIKNIFLNDVSNEIHLIIIMSLISIVIFFLLLISAKELRKEDISFFIQLLKIGNYKRSLKEELKNL